MTLPILLFLGFPPHMANATNRLNVLAAACASAVVFARQGKIDWAHVPHVLMPTVAGAILGAKLAASERSKVWVCRVLVITILGEIVHMV